MAEIKRFLQEENAMGVVEVILIIAVLIAVVIIFKDKIKAFVNSIFGQTESSSSRVFTS